MKKHNVLLACVLSVFMPLNLLQGATTIQITQGTADPIPIAITNFIAEEGGSIASDYGQDIAKIMAADLENSGLFRQLDPGTFLQSLEDVHKGPRFADWRVIKAHGLVIGSIANEKGNLRVNFRLYDVMTEKQIAGLTFRASPQEWRRIAHKISDVIYKTMTGEEGYFDSKILYIKQLAYRKNTRSQMMCMDQDGANIKPMSGDGHLVLSPRFSPDLRKIAYMDYGVNNRSPAVYIVNVASGKREKVGHFKGMTYGPRFSWDGKKLLLSHSQRGNSSIYVMDLATRQTTQLTKGPHIDVSACYSPDERKIVFVSNRSGRPKLYLMDQYGQNVERISFGEGSYFTPVWSPRGDLIAFTKISQGRFYIGVMRPDGSGERLLADGYLVEEPTWSPNGRVIIYSRREKGQGQKSSIWSIDLTGQNERQIAVEKKQDLFSPAWSPLIP